jgi:hypothetical protein
LKVIEFYFEISGISSNFNLSIFGSSFTYSEHSRKIFTKSSSDNPPKSLIIFLSKHKHPLDYLLKLLKNPHK